MAKPKVFVSYDHSEDVLYKRLLQAWDANPDLDFEFDSRGPDVAIDSTRGSIIKAFLEEMMKRATHLLVIVGAKAPPANGLLGRSIGRNRRTSSYGSLPSSSKNRI